MDSGDQLPLINPSELPEAGITIAGSSTVYPLTGQLAIEFRHEGFAGTLNLYQTGTMDGFRLFCDGELDLSNASRPIEWAEVKGRFG